MEPPYRIFYPNVGRRPALSIPPNPPLKGGGSVGMNVNQCCGFTNELLKCKY